MVRKCYESWHNLNPGWKIILLDQWILPKYFDSGYLDNKENIGLQAKTDIIRVYLLSKYGGVWADATLYCKKPLDTWLPEYISDGFFAFKSEKKDRIMTTWFLYGNQNSQLLNAWFNSINDYWINNDFKKQTESKKQILRKLTSLRKRHLVSNKIWFSKFVLNCLKVYPYPINMYLFEKAIQKNNLEQLWANAPESMDTIPEKLQNVFGINEMLTPESKQFLSSPKTTMHKLNWRQDKGEALPGSNLEFLLKSSGHQ